MTAMLPFYTTRQLSNLLNRKYNATRRIMSKLNIPSHKIGKKIVFYISEIKEEAPEFYKSMTEVIVFSDTVEIDDE